MTTSYILQAQEDLRDLKKMKRMFLRRRLHLRRKLQQNLKPKLGVRSNAIR